MLDKLRNWFRSFEQPPKPSGIVYTKELDGRLGDEETVDVTDFLQSRVKNNQLEIKDDAGNVILRIP